ncbi:hypothetical protein RB195_011051 [Necator americanus]|uniref:Uncharacterized protein n=1 Tax=Necator americanus TaxID=51031 RepID=A0ABR1D0M1_NECAM
MFATRRDGDGENVRRAINEAMKGENSAQERAVERAINFTAAADRLSAKGAPERNCDSPRVSIDTINSR